MATATAERDEVGEEQKKRKQGGFRTMPFILANEICDRFATAGFGANLITYLTQQLHLPLVEASNTLTNFSGTSSLTPILGALAADAFAGRFWTIIAGSVFYQLGMLALVASALLPSLRPAPCAPPHSAACRRATGWQLAVLYLALLCTSLGSGGIRPCVVAFGADQFDDQQQKQRQKGGGGGGGGGGEAVAVGRKRRYFNLYFFTMGFAVLLALTVVVYIQENVGWGWGFGIPAIAMFVSIVVFVAGYPLYVRLKPGGSPFTRLAQVVAAAFRKRRAAVPEDPGMLYQDKELDALISTNGRLLHTNQLTFFDRAAIVTPGDITGAGSPDLWRLSTVHRVEELKSIVRLLPIWSAGILLATAASHNGTFTIQQARTMDRHLTPRFQIPPATMSIFTTVSMLVGLALYDRAFVPLARRVTGLPSGITYFQRMAIGLGISILGVASAALVEVKRRGAAADHGLLDSPAAVVPISVFWLVPQYAVHGVAEAFSSVAHMEFLYDQAPESMRSSAAALFWLSSSLGNYMGTVLVTAVQRATRGGGEWLQDNINRGRLDCYYWLVTTLMVLNLGYYLVCFHFYTMKPLEVTEEDDDEKECELSSVHKNGGAGALV
uniref:Major facilitator superfamily (MFS) profile domain-containing protein n=1 Tax=Oryza punctata TaxID=4537 RepID=A0A0E0L2H8_ORYPU